MACFFWSTGKNSIFEIPVSGVKLLVPVVSGTKQPHIGLFRFGYIANGLN